MDEDWSDMEEDFPYNIFFDKKGQPVAYVRAGDWKVRAGIVQGRRQRLMRYTYRLTLLCAQLLIKRSRTYPNVTQVVILMNMDGFSVAHHGCSMCIPSYFNILDSYERFFPGVANEVIVVNGKSKTI